MHNSNDAAKNQSVVLNSSPVVKNINKINYIINMTMWLTDNTSTVTSVLKTTHLPFRWECIYCFLCQRDTWGLNTPDTRTVLASSITKHSTSLGDHMTNHLDLLADFCAWCYKQRGLVQRCVTAERTWWQWRWGDGAIKLVYHQASTAWEGFFRWLCDIYSIRPIWLNTLQ